MRVFLLIKTLFVIAFLLVSGISCSENEYSDKEMTVLCVPVYGQSYALGEEAQLITNFDSLRINTNHRVLTQRLDEDFGYFDNSKLKQFLKRMIRYKKRQFELSIYGMADEFFKHCDNDSILLCTFPGGRGETSITGMMPGSDSYMKFIDEIQEAYDRSKNKGWKFYMPAFCWMQGENDIVWQTSKNYKKDLQDWYSQFCLDVKKITGQEEEPVCICYQSNCLSLSKLPVADTLYNRPEMYVPNAQYQLIRDDDMFMASGPSYPYHVVNEVVHIDGIGQRTIGRLAGLTLWRIVNHQNSDGLQYRDYRIVNNHELEILFNVPSPPLCFDTVQVINPGNYGFNVISPEGIDICSEVRIVGDSAISIRCKDDLSNARVSYAVNGVKNKNGNKNGSRGCLRDTQTDSLFNWAYQFSFTLN